MRVPTLRRTETATRLAWHESAAVEHETVEPPPPPRRRRAPARRAVPKGFVDPTVRVIDARGRVTSFAPDAFKKRRRS